MEDERYKELMFDGSAHLTEEEVQEGWFWCFCVSGDGMLCHKEAREPICKCG